MKKIEVVAYHGQGKDKTFAGKTTVEVPTTLAEAGRMKEWGEERTLARAVGSYVIEVQRSLRGPKAISEEEKAFKALPPSVQAKILRLAKSEGAAPKAKRAVKKRKAGSTETVPVTQPTDTI